MPDRNPTVKNDVNVIFVFMLKVTDEKKDGSDHPRIRIRTIMSRIRNTAKNSFHLSLGLLRTSKL